MREVEACQLGLEPTFNEFIAEMVAVFREVRRVLRPDGTLWLNLGDSYNSQNGFHRGGYKYMDGGKPRVMEYPDHFDRSLKPKDLCGIPWRVALALQEDGWWLRQDIIWSKPNPMPESVTDRCTKAHEYVFLLSKSAKYFYDADAIKETVSETAGAQAWRKIFDPAKQTKEAALKETGMKCGNDGARNPHATGRNKRSVWEIATSTFPEAHFATFPPALVEPCIRAGTSEKGCCGKCGAPWVRVIERGAIPMTERRKNLAATQRQGHPDYIETVRPSSLGAGSGGDVPARSVETLGWSPTCTCQAAVVSATVLDPFGGAGTTALVADRLQRKAILIELNPKYAEMAKARIQQETPLFASAPDLFIEKPKPPKQEAFL